MPKKLGWLIILLAVIIGVFYLYRAYAAIYQRITAANLTAPKYQTVYVLGNAGKATGNIYVALGDSLSSGVGVDNYDLSYPYLVAQSLAENSGGATLINQSFPGARSADIINSLLDKTIKAQPEIITILVGINDVHGNLSSAAFAKNYEDILIRLTQETNARIYAVSIPYIGDSSLIRWPYNYYFQWRIENFNRKIKNLASRYDVQYVDLYTPTLKAFRQAGPHYAADHFHPSASGYALWASIIYDRLSQ